jgi:hypothetical protein
MEERAVRTSELASLAGALKSPLLVWEGGSVRGDFGGKGG